MHARWCVQPGCVGGAGDKSRTGKLETHSRVRVSLKGAKAWQEQEQEQGKGHRLGHQIDTLTGGRCVS